jgi:hypothetical protein
MSTVADAVSAIDDLIVLLHKKIDLMVQLKRALLLADLLGIPPKQITGKLSRGAYELDRRITQRWRGYVLRVTYEGETREFPLKDVHLDLWPADLRADYQRHKARNQQLPIHDAAS